MMETGKAPSTSSTRFGGRLEKAKARIKSKMEIKESNDIYFLILYELPYIFAESKMIAGFLGTKDEPTDIYIDGMKDRNQHIVSQPLNTLHLTERSISRDYFELMVESISNSCDVEKIDDKVGKIIKINNPEISTEINLYKNLGITLGEKREIFDKPSHAFYRFINSSDCFELHTIFYFPKRDQKLLKEIYEKYQKWLSHLFRTFSNKSNHLPRPSCLQYVKKPELKNNISLDAIENYIYTQSFLDDSVDHTLIEIEKVRKKGDGPIKALFLRTKRPEVNYISLLVTPKMCEPIFEIFFNKSTREERNATFHEATDKFIKYMEMNKSNLQMHRYVRPFDKENVDRLKQLLDKKYNININSKKVASLYAIVADRINCNICKLFPWSKCEVCEKIYENVDPEQYRKEAYDIVKLLSSGLYQDPDIALAFTMISKEMMEIPPMAAGITYTVGQRGYPFWTYRWHKGQYSKKEQRIGLGDHPFLARIPEGQRSFRYPEVIEFLWNEKFFKETNNFMLMIDIPLLCNGLLIGVFLIYAPFSNPKDILERMPDYLNDFMNIVDRNCSDLIRAFFLDICGNLVRILAGDWAHEGNVEDLLTDCLWRAEKLVYCAHEVPRTFIIDCTKEFKKKLRGTLENIFMLSEKLPSIEWLIASLINVVESDKTYSIFYNAPDQVLPPLKLLSGKEENLISDKHFANCRMITIDGWKFLVLQLQSKNENLLSVREKNNANYIIQAIETGLSTFKKKYDILKHGIRAAVIAIVSRNHSHHIGSHVTPRSKVSDIIMRIKELNCNVKYHDKLKIVNILKSNLDGYIQKKADFTAEIATEPLISTKSIDFFARIVVRFIQQTLLMDGLGANEGIRYKKDDCIDNRLKIECQRQGEPFQPRFHCKHNTDHKYSSDSYPYTDHCCLCNSIQGLNQEPIEKDLVIAVPGLLGEYAVFCFLENFIRNAVKHNLDGLRERPDKNMVVSINVGDYDNEFYRVQLWDNFTDPCKLVPRANGKEGFQPLLEMLDHLIKQTIVTNDGTLKKGGWGVAEMKIMATLLGGSTDFLKMWEHLTVESAEKVVDEEKKNVLLYQFKVMKPKELAIVIDSYRVAEMANLREHGIWIFQDLEELCKHLEEAASPAAFNFVFFEKIKGATGEDLKRINDLLPKIPFRVFYGECELAESPLKSYIEGAWAQAFLEEFLTPEFLVEPNKMIEKAWEVWVEYLKACKCMDKTSLLIHLQQGIKEEPTLDWVMLAEQLTEKTQTDKRLTVIGSQDAHLSISQLEDNIIFFDRHGRGIGKLQESLWPRVRFYEAIDKGSEDFTNIFHAPSSPQMVEKLTEAALLNVLILDERIAEAAHENVAMVLSIEKHLYPLYTGVTGGEVKRIHLALTGNVFIGTHLEINGRSRLLHDAVHKKFPQVVAKFEIDKDKKTVDSFSVALVQKKTLTDPADLGPVDILIVHMGVLENFFKDIIGTHKDNYDNLLKELRMKIPFIVVDSGRGIPSELPDSAKFFPYSLLEDYLLKGGLAKYNLCQVVMGLTRRNAK